MDLWRQIQTNLRHQSRIRKLHRNKDGVTAEITVDSSTQIMSYRLRYYKFSPAASTWKDMSAEKQQDTFAQKEEGGRETIPTNLKQQWNNRGKRDNEAEWHPVHTRKWGKSHYLLMRVTTPGDDKMLETRKQWGHKGSTTSLLRANAQSLFKVSDRLQPQIHRLQTRISHRNMTRLTPSR